MQSGITLKAEVYEKHKEALLLLKNCGDKKQLESVDLKSISEEFKFTKDQLLCHMQQMIRIVLYYPSGESRFLFFFKPTSVVTENIMNHKKDLIVFFEKMTSPPETTILAIPPVSRGLMVSSIT